MNEIEKAIRHFKNQLERNQVILNDDCWNEQGKNSIVYENRKFYLDLAIQALREKQEREAGCSICNNTKLYKNPKNKFCRHCGSKLNKQEPKRKAGE